MIWNSFIRENNYLVPPPPPQSNRSYSRCLSITHTHPHPSMCVKVPPGVDDWGDQLADRTMEIASTGMTVGVRATRGLARHRFHDGTNAAAGHKS